MQKPGDLCEVRRQLAAGAHVQHRRNERLVQHHLPAFVGYLVYIGEVVAPALLIVGLFTRAAAAIIVINMIFAVLLAHAGELFSMEKSGGYALELQALYLVTAIVVALIGAGRYSIGGLYGRWN